MPECSVAAPPHPSYMAGVIPSLTVKTPTSTSRALLNRAAIFHKALQAVVRARPVGTDTCTGRRSRHGMMCMM
jgi:hypothetical protein